VARLRFVTRTVYLCLVCIWAAPATLLGLSLGMLALFTGGTARRVGRVVEIHGGLAKTFLERFPGEPIAMTLGHTVIGRTQAGLDITRAHELVHVKQYERWGVFMLPAYLACSLCLWLIGRDPYRDNPFEKQAFREAP
jgi:hypothetical protein